MNIKEILQQYENLKIQEKSIASKKKELASQIKEYATQNGTKDTKGSSYCTQEGFIFGNVARTSIKLNSDKALDYFRCNKPELVERVTRTITIVDEDLIEDILSEGLIDHDELEEMVDKKTTYSVSVVEEKVEDECKVVVESRVKPKFQLKKLKRL